MESKRNIDDDVDVKTILSSQCNRPLIFAILGGAGLIAVAFVVGLCIGLRNGGGNNDDKQEGSKNGYGVRTTLTQTFKSATGTYNYAAVVADSKVCSKIGA
ncbi:hypothetical protein PoB_006318800 [Plakobranchus ocellatus]|uniref:Uncharacterized protein n=1 Tax=Plakobranchus ocellatus TaxID=259542 RepID=A0AAV4CXW2_9GAST|nr:hypothetical protein PoB_006318800 [Plakobranchus ocellatus]